jgi:hypothetical protein
MFVCHAERSCILALSLRVLTPHEHLGEDIELDDTVEPMRVIRFHPLNLPAGVVKDPDNPGMFLGWGVYSDSPWFFADLFGSRQQAEAEARRKSDKKLKVSYGSHRPGTADFGLLPEP